MTPAPEAARHRTILVVEDDPDEASIYNVILTHSGMQVLHAQTAEQALELARSNRPDLILMDIHLGEGKTGLDAIQELRADPETRSVPILVHTSYYDVFDRRLEQVGYDRMLRKPTSPSVVRNTVLEMLGIDPDPV